MSFLLNFIEKSLELKILYNSSKEIYKHCLLIKKILHKNENVN